MVPISAQQLKTNIIRSAEKDSFDVSNFKPLTSAYIRKKNKVPDKSSSSDFARRIFLLNKKPAIEPVSL